MKSYAAELKAVGFNWTAATPPFERSLILSRLIKTVAWDQARERERIFEQEQAAERIAQAEKDRRCAQDFRTTMGRVRAPIVGPLRELEEDLVETLVEDLKLTELGTIEIDEQEEFGCADEDPDFGADFLEGCESDSSGDTQYEAVVDDGPGNRARKVEMLERFVREQVCWAPRYAPAMAGLEEVDRGSNCSSDC